MPAVPIMRMLSLNCWHRGAARAALSIWWALRTSVSCLPVNAAWEQRLENYRASVRPSVCLSHQATGAGLLPWRRWPGDIDRLLHSQRTDRVQQQMRAVPPCYVISVYAVAERKLVTDCDRQVSLCLPCKNDNSSLKMSQRSGLLQSRYCAAPIAIFDTALLYLLFLAVSWFLAVLQITPLYSLKWRKNKSNGVSKHAATI